MAKKNGIAQTFEARLTKGGDRELGWTVVPVPFVPADVWTERVRHRVRGTMNGFAFRTSLFPDPARAGHFVLLVNKSTQRAGGATLGDMASFMLEPDLEPRPAELPDGLDALLDEVDGLRAFYNSLSESWRREVGKWIAGVQSEAAQVKRCEQMAERLANAMESERELPPAIDAAFRKRPKARAGWARLTPVQRRGHLLGVFYYQSPEARAKRIGKLCDDAEAKA